MNIPKKNVSLYYRYMYRLSWGSFLISLMMCLTPYLMTSFFFTLFVTLPLCILPAASAERRAKRHGRS